MIMESPVSIKPQYFRQPGVSLQPQIRPSQRMTYVYDKEISERADCLGHRQEFAAWNGTIPWCLRFNLKPSRTWSGAADQVEFTKAPEAGSIFGSYPITRPRLSSLVESHNEFRLTVRTGGLDTASFRTFVALVLLAARAKATPGIRLFALVLGKHTLQLHGMTLFNSFCFGIGPLFTVTNP